MMEEGLVAATVEDGFSKIDSNRSDAVGSDLNDFGFDDDGNEEQNP